MSFNLGTKINNIQVEIDNIIGGAVTNPLRRDLNCNNRQLTNVNTVGSVLGTPLNLTAGTSTVNIASAVNMVDNLTITNNLPKNGLVVTDAIGDTSCFVVGANGDVGVKVNPISIIGADFTVNGAMSSNSLSATVLTATGNMNCLNLTATGTVAVPAITGLSTINGVPYTTGGSPVLGLTNRSAQKSLQTNILLSGDGSTYNEIDTTKVGLPDIFTPIIQNPQVNTIVLTYYLNAVQETTGQDYTSNQNFVTYQLLTSIDGGTTQVNQYLYNYNVPTNAEVGGGSTTAYYLYTGGNHTLTFYLYRGIHFTSDINNTLWTLYGVAQYENPVYINANINNLGASFPTSVTIFDTI